MIIKFNQKIITIDKLMFKRNDGFSKKGIKNKLDDEGYKYASDLSKSGAEKLIQSDFVSR